MTHSDSEGLAFHTGMIKTGAALVGGGLMLASVGMALAGAAIARGAAAWARQREVSPRALAADQIDRVRQATLAGAHAWQEHAHSANGHHSHAR